MAEVIDQLEKNDSTRSEIEDRQKAVNISFEVQRIIEK